MNWEELMLLLGIKQPQPYTASMGQATTGRVGPATVWQTEFPQYHARPDKPVSPGPLVPIYKALKPSGGKNNPGIPEDFWGDTKPVFTVDR